MYSKIFKLVLCHYVACQDQGRRQKNFQGANGKNKTEKIAPLSIPPLYHGVPSLCPPLPTPWSRWLFY